MKTTQALEIKLTLFVKMQVGEEKKGKGKGKEEERGKVKEKSLSDCIDACKNHIVYQAIFCPISKHTVVIAKQKSYKDFPLNLFWS